MKNVAEDDTVGSPVRPGQMFVMRVQPPPQYAGRVGARATVASVSKDVYVLFEGGIRESFPVHRFAQYFEAVPVLRRGRRPVHAGAVRAPELARPRALAGSR